MSKSIQIQIPKPCHENWNTMDETAKGRFCNSCCKEVIDFTLMSDSQIIQYFSKSHQNVCGRFANEQLNKNLVVKNERKLPFFKYFIHVIIPALLISNKTSAQVKITGDTMVCTPPNLIKNQIALSGTVGGLVVGKRIEQDYITIKGKITDTNHLPIPFATILIKGTKKGVSANADGEFELKVSSKEKKVVLMSSCVGCEPAETQVDLKNIHNGIVEVSIITMLRTTTGLGEVVVVAGYAVVKNKEKKPFLQPAVDTITNVFIKDTVKVYPNPVHVGGMVNIDFDVKNAGEYNLTILNISGQIVMNKKIELNSKQQIEQITFDNHITPGIYVVQITGALSKKYYSNKIMVL